MQESELWKEELYRALTGGRYKERGSIAVPQTTQLTKIRSPVTDWALLIFSNKPTGQPNFNILVKFLNRSSRKRLARARNMKDISNRPSPFEGKTFDQRLSDLNALNGVKQNSIREHSNIHSLRNERSLETFFFWAVVVTQQVQNDPWPIGNRWQDIQCFKYKGWRHCRASQRRPVLT